LEEVGLVVAMAADSREDRGAVKLRKVWYHVDFILKPIGLKWSCPTVYKLHSFQYYEILTSTIYIDYVGWVILFQIIKIGVEFKLFLEI